MKPSTQKKWGQPLDYKPDFYAWQDHEEDHVAEQFKAMFGGYWKQVSFIVQACICGGIAGSILGYWWMG